ncbi:gag-pol fusion protein-like protein [Dinothrombium tinctorium]|uniref:RNA-directed DNA polymerase n=1 Tax=Dinothrombium tinctorium TaxID=1965070 RepID=A0A443QKN0_9ACAR|nr:gag-pol fusion protein-like protein [Dinothrombium tinctorium]
MNVENIKEGCKSNDGNDAVEKRLEKTAESKRFDQRIKKLEEAMERMVDHIKTIELSMDQLLEYSKESIQRQATNPEEMLTSEANYEKSSVSSQQSTEPTTKTSDWPYYGNRFFRYSNVNSDFSEVSRPEPTVDIQKFDGVANPLQFIISFQRACKISRFNEKQVMYAFQYAMTEMAAAWFTDAFPNEVSVYKWKQLKEKFSKRFDVEAATINALRAVREMKIHYNETMEYFIKRFEEAMFLTHVYINETNQGFYAFELMMLVPKEIQNSITPTHNYCKLKRQLITKGKIYQREIKCYRCGEYGHLSTNCYESRGRRRSRSRGSSRSNERSFSSERRNSKERSWEKPRNQFETNGNKKIDSSEERNRKARSQKIQERSPTPIRSSTKKSTRSPDTSDDTDSITDNRINSFAVLYTPCSPLYADHKEPKTSFYRNRVFINGLTERKAVIDTGAQISIISRDFIDELIANRESFTVLKLPCRLRTVIGEKEAMREFARLHVNIIDYECDFSFLIQEENCGFRLLIGIDFISKLPFKLIMDPIKRKVYPFDPDFKQNLAKIAKCESKWKKKFNGEIPEVPAIETCVTKPGTAFNVGKGCTSTQEKKVLQVLNRYRHLFVTSIRELRLMNGKDFELDTGNAEPIKKTPYRATLKQREAINEEVKKMLDAGLIEPSNSPWAAPVFLIPKKDGTYRFVIDYRDLNETLVKDSYPMPRVDDSLDAISQAKYLSIIDCRSGYFQRRMGIKSRPKAAFVTPDGSFQPKVMMFGLATAPADFQRAMDNVIGKAKMKFAIVYIDDILIYSKTLEEHLNHLDYILSRIEKANLRLAADKCEFLKEKITFLGHEISAKGIQPSKDKVHKVLSFRRPRTPRQVQQFLGLVNFYRKFIPNLSKIERPLRKLTFKDAEFKWTDDCEAAFKLLKKILCSEPILAHFDDDKEPILKTDASNEAIGVVLAQEDDEGIERVIAYGGRSLNKAEKNYSTTEKECLAVMYAVKAFQQYLHGRRFKIVSDHHALCWIRKMKNGNSKLMRWSIELSTYGYYVEYRAGKKHADADCLSRYPSDAFEAKLLNSTKDPEEVHERIVYFTQNEQSELMDIDKWIEQQRNDQLCKNIRAKIERGLAEDFTIIDGLLFKRVKTKVDFKDLIVVPAKLRRTVLTEFHNCTIGGHFGQKKTTEKINTRFWWPTISKDVREYTKRCQECQNRYTPKIAQQGFLNPTEPIGIWHKVSIDFLGPLTETDSGNKWIIVAQDSFSKWLEMCGVPDTKAETVANFIVYRIILKHGTPFSILSDRGLQFQSKLVKELCTALKIHKLSTTPYKPSTNGQVERANATIVEMLAKFTNENQSDWDQLLPFLQFAYNTATQETTKFSPFFINMGREAIYPIETSIPARENMDTTVQYVQRVQNLLNGADQLVKEHIKKRQEIDATAYNRNKTDVKFKEGDLVSVYSNVPQVGKSQKLLNKWTTKGKIIKMSQNKLVATVKLLSTDEIRRVSVKNIKPYFLPLSPRTIEEMETDEEQKENQNQDEIEHNSQETNPSVPAETTVIRTQDAEVQSQLTETNTITNIEVIETPARSTVPTRNQRSEKAGTSTRESTSRQETENWEIIDTPVLTPAKATRRYPRRQRRKNVRFNDFIFYST